MMYGESCMGRMVRKQVYIELEQDRLLKQRSAELGVTESALIRKGIDHVTNGRDARPLDDQAWEEELAFIEERARTLPATGGERGWTREEIYDERWNRRLSR